MTISPGALNPNLSTPIPWRHTCTTWQIHQPPWQFSLCRQLAVQTPCIQPFGAHTAPCMAYRQHGLLAESWQTQVHVGP